MATGVGGLLRAAHRDFIRRERRWCIGSKRVFMVTKELNYVLLLKGGVIC